MGSQVRGDQRPGPPSDRTRVVIGSTIVLILLVMLASTVGSPIAGTPDRDFKKPSQTLSSSSTSTIGADIPTQTIPEDPRSESPPWLSVLIGALGFAIVATLAWLVLRWLARAWRERRRDTAPAPPPIPPEAAAAALLEDRHQHWDALAEGTPDEAIVAMWVALEQSVARAGVQRSPSETSGELTLRVLDHLNVDGDAVETLAALYREARFSRHQLSDVQRERARGALRQVHDSLSRRHQASPEVEESP